MDERSFSEFEARLRQLNDAKEYLRAIHLIEDEGDRYPDQYVTLMYWKIGMAARDGNPDLALAYLDELIEEGIWISQYLLRNSPSMELLQDEIEFDTRVDAMAVLQRREAAQLLPLLTLRQGNTVGPGEEPYPLLIGLHEERRTALHSIKLWQPAATQGWLVGAPQSTQALWSGAYVWEDLGQTQNELIHHFKELASKYRIDPSRVILAGHGQGGEMAAWLPLSGGMQVRGFIALAPRGPLISNPDRWFHMLQASNPVGMRGVFLQGEHDEALRPELKRLVDILNAFDVPSTLVVVPGAGREEHPAFHEALLQAIDYILT